MRRQQPLSCYSKKLIRHFLSWNTY
uniref:Uncharacterized protein n=1 Tax=Anguilla anguilla TaxID=7936 RepID=A0A0E9SRN7_ANGAN